MRKPVRGVLLWLTNNINYNQKYVVAGLVRAIGYFILFFSLLYLVQSNLSLINMQLSNGELHKPVQEIFELIEGQEFIVAEGKVSEKKSKLANANFNKAFEKLRSTIRAGGMNSDEVVDQLDRVQGLWITIQDAASEENLKGVLESGAEIQSLLAGLIQKQSDTFINGKQPLNASYLILEKIQRRLRDDQSLIRVAEENMSEQSKIGSLPQSMIVAALKRSITLTQDELYKVRGFLEGMPEFDEGQKKIRLTLNQYAISLQELTQELSQPGQRGSIAETANAMSYNYNLWSEIGNELNAILEHRKSSLWHSLTIIFTLAAAFTIFGSWLGVHFVYEAIKSFRDLDRATKALTTGDLSARVQIVYREEIGKASEEFNRMANYLEKLLTQQGRLFEATSRVAQGDFSARVDIDVEANEELNKVTISFNKMVGTFEEIVKRLKRLGVNLSTSTNEITEASKRQEALIVDQGEATREISLTASEISTTAKDFALTISDVSGVAEQTSDLASDGQDSLIRMEEIMRQMVNASKDISTKLTILNEKAGNITKVVTTIKNVARQTNLLSLNAAIEAEMTGKYSRDFGVIAREIRRLADQTALATYDIEEIVNEIMTAVGVSVTSVEDFTGEIHSGVTKVAEVGEQLGTIIVQVQALAYRFESVNEGMQQQSISAGAINDGMVQLSHAAGETSNSLSEFQQTIETLSISADDLSHMIEEISEQE